MRRGTDMCCGCGAGLDVELLEDVLDVRSHGMARDPQFFGYLRVRISGGERVKNFALARRQRVECVTQRLPPLSMKYEVWSEQYKQLAVAIAESPASPIEEEEACLPGRSRKKELRRVDKSERLERVLVEVEASSGSRTQNVRRGDWVRSGREPCEPTCDRVLVMPLKQHLTEPVWLRERANVVPLPAAARGEIAISRVLGVEEVCESGDHRTREDLSRRFTREVVE